MCKLNIASIQRANQAMTSTEKLLRDKLMRRTKFLEFLEIGAFATCIYIANLIITNYACIFWQRYVVR